VVLSFEYQVRKLAFKLVCADNKPLSEALALACKDSETKDVFFTCAIALRVERFLPHNPPGNSDWPPKDTKTKKGNPKATAEEQWPRSK
jgi:hypothetical protein